MNNRSTLSPAAEAGVTRRTAKGREHVFTGVESCLLPGKRRTALISAAVTGKIDVRVLT